MHIATILVTRSRSCHVKTLHVMLRFNVMCLEKGHSHEIVYVNDDAHEKAEILTKSIKGNSDKILFIDFGVHLNDEALAQVFEKQDCVIFPAPKEGINWGMFKDKVLGDTKENIGQVGLDFDTEVGKKVSDGYYTVKSTTPKTWVMNTKATYKALKQKKGQGIYIPTKISDLFEKLLQKELKILAFTKAVVTVTYPHECIANILQASGVKVN